MLEEVHAGVSAKFSVGLFWPSLLGETRGARYWNHGVAKSILEHISFPTKLCYPVPLKRLGQIKR